MAVCCVKLTHKKQVCARVIFKNTDYTHTCQALALFLYDRSCSVIIHDTFILNICLERFFIVKQVKRLIVQCQHPNDLVQVLLCIVQMDLGVNPICCFLQWLFVFMLFSSPAPLGAQDAPALHCYCQLVPANGISVGVVCAQVKNGWVINECITRSLKMYCQKKKASQSLQVK